MHARLIALVDWRDDEASLDARMKAQDRLKQEGLVEGGGLFGPPPADWFVIGGRWSGCLTLARIGEHRLKAFWDAFDGNGLEDKGSERHRARGEALFRGHFPEMNCDPPMWRTSHRPYGYEDDAQVLDEAICGFLKKLGQYPVAADIDRLLRGGCFVDLDDSHEQLTQEAIGRKWCVVVDFHY